MKYTKEFKEIVKLGAFIGNGNPNSKILIVGKEVATEIKEGVNEELEKQNLKSLSSNSLDWEKNIENNISQKDIENWTLEKGENNPLFAFKGTIKKHTSDTWRKYQKLYDAIFKGEINRNNELELDFQERFFITEMSEIPSKTTNDAQKRTNFSQKLQHRKNTFFKSEFVQNFPVIVLACSNYIVNNDENREIDDIFKVKFIEEKGTEKQKFWIHKSTTNKPKLVIHTRQLSNVVEDNLLIGIAKEIKEFLNNYCC